MSDRTHKNILIRSFHKIVHAFDIFASFKCILSMLLETIRNKLIPFEFVKICVQRHFANDRYFGVDILCSWWNEYILNCDENILTALSVHSNLEFWWNVVKLFNWTNFKHNSIFGKTVQVNFKVCMNHYWIYAY